MRELYLIPLSHIISVSAIQTRQNNQVDDPFAEVFEGDAGTDDVIRDTGQYKFVGSLFPKNPIMPNSEVGFSVADRLEPVKDPIFNPWDDPKSKNWFKQGTRIPEVGVQKEKLIPLQEGKNRIPVVGKSIDYVPPWMIEYNRNSFRNPVPTSESKNMKFPNSELSASKIDKDVSYGEFPVIPLSFPPFAGNFQKPHILNISAGKNEDIMGQNWEGGNTPPGGSRADEDMGKMLFTTGSNFLDIGRQNYWDPAFGFWPTHTVNPSNINVLEVAETPPGEACPFNWKHHKNSCYLLRNQELFPGELVTTLYKASWYTAKATCIALGGYLAEINNADEQNFVQKTKIENHVALLWIGATDLRQAGYWEWSQSKKTVEEFSYWARPGRGATGPVGRGHCLALRGDGKWDSFRCPNRFPYLCEKGAAIIEQPTTTRPVPTTTGLKLEVCTTVTLEAASWMKLSSKLLTHPPRGRCHIRIEFSTFSDGLVLRKFDWNDESISLIIAEGQPVLRMMTGLRGELSVSSPYIVNDGLQHVVLVSFGVGIISLKVDDDLIRELEDDKHPGLPQDANVFLGGEPGGKYSGFSGCIYSFNVYISPNINEQPIWKKSLEFNFQQKDSSTVFYGNHVCGVCNMREIEEDSHQDIWDNNPKEEENWYVEELPRPMTTWRPYQEISSKSPTPVSDDSVIIESKPLIILDTTTRRTMKASTVVPTKSTPPTYVIPTNSVTYSTLHATTERTTLPAITQTSTLITKNTTTSTTTTKTTTVTSATTTVTTKTTTATRITYKTVSTTRTTTKRTTLPTMASTANEFYIPELEKEECTAQQVYLNGAGWLELSRKVIPQRRNMKTVITLRFATREDNALVLWQGDYKSGHYFALAIVRGRLEFTFNLGSGRAVIRSTKSVNRGKEHEVVITREENKGSLQLDRGAVIKGTAQGTGRKLILRRSPVYLGGAPFNSNSLPPAKLYKTGFKGCILKMRVENKKVLEDDSGLGGFGADIDFTDNRLLKDWANSVRCMDKCFV